MPQPSETIGHMTDRWTVLINEINRYRPEKYPELLRVDVCDFVREVEQLVSLDPFERDLLLTARTLVEHGDLKIGMFKLQEVLSGRLP